MARLKFFLVLNFIIVSAVHAYGDIMPFYQKLDSPWKFCPVESYKPNIDISTITCHPIDIPNKWETIIPDYNGFGILHTTFTFKSLSQNQLAFYTKNIRDADKVYINGQLIGQTGEFPPYYQKAVFYSRLYPIPVDLLTIDKPNTLTIWVYNGGRPGGIVHDTPIIAPFIHLTKKQQKKGLLDSAFIVILLVFSLFSLITYIFNKSAMENLYYGLFLTAWSIYLLTSSDLVQLYHLPLNTMFRLNVALFFITLLFFYSFFKEPIPKVVQGILVIELISVPFCVFVPIPEQIYPFVALVEILMLPTALYLSWLLIKTNKARVKYAKQMSLILSLYVFFGLIEIYLDLFSANEASKFSLFGPWILLVLSLLLTFVIGHKNMSYYQKATFDGLTGALRFENFSIRLTKLIKMSIKQKKFILVMMIDLDDFKEVNDKYGHIQGDKVLMQVSKAMENELRSLDLISRYGGDEFCIAVMMNNTKDIIEFVKNFHKQINELEIDYLTQKIKVNITIGVAISNPNNPLSSEGLVKIADDLLIDAKLNSKGHIKW